MDRRLYFLFPSERHLHRVIYELNDAGIDDMHLHVVSYDDLARENKPLIQQLHRMDKSWILEKIIRVTNLALFSLAAIGLVLSLLSGFHLWVLVSTLIMLVTSSSGFWFSQKVPHVHLEDFHDALAHDEYLLMVVVPKNRVAEIEDLIQRRHPEANVGGVGWSIEALGV
jgi:hypothetical protein